MGLDHSLAGVFVQVGNAFNQEKADRELKLIASDPKETHVFKVTNYMALNGLLSQLQQRIIHMEGEGSQEPWETPSAFSQTPSLRPTLPDSDHLLEPQLLTSKTAMASPGPPHTPESLKVC